MSRGYGFPAGSARTAVNWRGNWHTLSIGRELGWEPRENFDSGLRKTVTWYLTNRWWWEPIWLQSYSGERLGASTSGSR